MKKLTFILVWFLLLNCNSKESASEHAAQKPNILFILVDDLGKEWVGAYGAGGISTPNIDRLAETGLLFDNFYSMPQCTPTRVTFLTGQYPFRHGWINHWDVPRWGGGAHYDEQLNPCLPLELKKAGYKTCVAGKWQIDDFRVEPDAMEKCGFDSYCMWTGYETGNPASAERYQNPFIFTNGASETKNGAFGPNIFLNHIIDFIHSNKEEPMFIYYPMVLTHTPFVDTPDDSASDNMGKHIAMVKYTDKITGQLMEVLERENILENTLVIWTTDNGTSGLITGDLNGYSVRGGKGSTRESGICEPFIVNWKGTTKAGTRTNALIDMTDIYPTLLDIAHVNMEELNSPLGAASSIDGISFKDLLYDQKKESAREWILGMGGGNNARLSETGVENQYVFRDRVVRNKRYKLYIDSKRNPIAFYDLEKDPFEENNIINWLDEKQKYEFENLSSLIELFPERDNDPIYKENPAQAWDVEITVKSEIWKR